VHQQLSILLLFLHSYHTAVLPEFVRVRFGDYLQVSISRNEDEDPILRDSEAAQYIHILLSKDILDVDRMRGQ
jgi:hypothetical protein